MGLLDAADWGSLKAFAFCARGMIIYCVVVSDRRCNQITLSVRCYLIISLFLNSVYFGIIWEIIFDEIEMGCTWIDLGNVFVRRSSTSRRWRIVRLYRVTAKREQFAFISAKARPKVNKNHYFSSQPSYTITAAVYVRWSESSSVTVYSKDILHSMHLGTPLTHIYLLHRKD